jgi:hypothetical protein
MKKIILTFKKLLELDESINHDYSISIKYIPKTLDYKSFINIICSDSLCYIPSLKWKHMVNNIDGNNNKFPLFWACYYRNFKTINILIENGSIYSPYNIPSIEYEYLYFNLEIKKIDICRSIIFKLKKSNTKYFKLKFKIFCGIQLNEEETNLNDYVTKYYDIIKILVIQFPGFINKDDNFINIIYFLFYNYFDISELLLRNANTENLKKILVKLGNVFNNYKIIYNNFYIKDDNNIFMKEYYRYCILSMMYFLKRKFIDNSVIININKSLEFDNLIKNKFGTFEIYDSIFYRLYINENNSDNYQDVCNKFKELGMTIDNITPVNDYYTGIMYLKMFSKFQNNELSYDKNYLLYQKVCNKFEEFGICNLINL